MDSYSFVEPEVASVRIPVGINADGEIAVSGDDVAGTKNVAFTYTKRDATANEILYGTSDTSTISTTGIVSTFLEYILGTTVTKGGMKRTIIQLTGADN